MNDSQRQVLLGRIIGAFGVIGEVKLESWTQPKNALLRYLPWCLRHRGQDRLIAQIKGRQTARGVVAKLSDIDSRDAAEALIGAEIWIARSQLPPAKPGQYYWVDLEGLNVVTIDGVLLGRISHLFATGANDVIAVEGDRLRYLPYINDVVKDVDLQARTMRVDWDPEF